MRNNKGFNVMEFIKDFICFIGIIIILIFSMAFGLLKFDEMVCNSYGEETQKEIKYEFATCYIKHNGEWLTYGERKSAIMGISRAVK